MCKVAHLYHPIIWCKCKSMRICDSLSHMRMLLHLHQTIGSYKCASLHMWFVIPYYHEIFIFAVSERWLIYDCETDCSFVYLFSFIT